MQDINFEMEHKYNYREDIPLSCPPQGASPVGTIFRATRKFPPKERDFAPDIETRKDADLSKCDSWGCSVWPNIEAAKHARRVFKDIFPRRYILRGDLSSTDGQVMHSPSKAQPDHTTFWKDIGSQIAHKFSVALPPESK